MIKVKIDKNKKGEPNFKLHFKKINEKRRKTFKESFNGR